MILVTVVCIYVLQLCFHIVTDPLLGSWPLGLRLVLLAGSVTALMTWLVMPRLARLLAVALSRGHAAGA
jgi:uncharacterized protein